MQRLQDRHLEFRGEITVFLSLIFILLISFVGAMIEATSISLTKSMKQADLCLAMESVFAEYDPELFRKYGIFAREGSGLFSISNRLSYYGAGNLNHEIVQMELLSDQNGQEVYRQAVTCMGGTVTQTKVSTENPYQEKAKSIKEQFEKLLKKEEAQGNQELQNMSAPFLLASILPKEEIISNKNINLSVLPSHRELNAGMGESSKAVETLSGKWLFASYLTKHFQDYTKSNHNNPLSYETEYLLAGKASDAKNLEWVVKRLLSIRVAVNYGYLLTQEEKLAEAETWAIGICTILMAPEAKELVKQVMLFYWAYGESKEDLQHLLQGEKVPLFNKEGNEEQGVYYEDYLKALLAAEKIEILCMRALDLLELNLGIQVDNCVTALELNSVGYARGKYRYPCKARFAYE